jgi:hypothetical protein
MGSRILVHFGITLLSLTAVYQISAQELSHFENLKHFLHFHKFQGALEFRNLHQTMVTLPEKTNCFVSEHNYLYFNEKLLLNLDGTGRLYEIGRDSISRIDKTCYDGYNFDAFYFVSKDSLYSVGGYGMWNYNGMIRVFNTKSQEWDVVTTNKMVPVRLWINSRPYFDFKADKMYVIYTMPSNIAFDYETQVNDTVYVQCLDMKTKKWWDRPAYLNRKYTDKSIWLNSIFLSTAQGELFLQDSRNTIFDFNRNRLLKVSTAKTKELFAEIVSNAVKYKFCVGNLAAFYKPDTDEVDTVTIDSTDYAQTNEVVYTFGNSSTDVVGKNDYAKYGVGFVLGSLLSYLVFLSFGRGKSSEGLRSETTDEVHDPHETILVNKQDTFRSNLTEIEKALLDLLVSNTSSGEKTQVGQLNQTLGLSKKPVKIQNNIRAATISMINKKFMVYAGIGDDLILKQRTEFDKRFFEYSIDQRFISKLRL